LIYGHNILSEDDIVERIIAYARNRIAAVREEIARLKQSDFPYAHPREALNLLDDMFQKQDQVLGKISPTTPANVVNNACSVSLYQLYAYVPVLGFVLRSTNVRNAFEVYAPLLRLARCVLGDDRKLVLSSEWEYSPFVYLPTNLPGFVLIGLPAPEAANPLLVSLAGHELGHSVWSAERFDLRFNKAIEDRVLDELTTKRWADYQALYPQYTAAQVRTSDMFVRPTWVPAFTWALLQVEEIFCDFFGLRLFAESYLRAFEYLVSPGTSGMRSSNYPKLGRRLTHLKDAAQKMGVDVQDGFGTDFMDEADPDEPATKLLVAIADDVSAGLVPELFELAMEVAERKGAPQRNADYVRSICGNFSNWVVPITKNATLTDIVNAGWICYLNPDLWKDIPQFKPEEKDRVLKDLMLKSMETSEIYTRLGEPL